MIHSLNKIKNKLSIERWIIILIGIISIWVSSNLSWGDDKPQTIIEADGKGYYAHLPALFIYNDLNFGFFEEYEGKKYYNKNLYYYYLKEFEGKRYNKYYVGTAVPMAPFFFMAHVISKIYGLPADGYSNLYHIFINIAAIFYLIVALIFFGKLMGRFNISAINKSLSYLIIYFGTNWFYYVNLEPAVSHVYTVAFVPMFLHYFLRFTDTWKYKHLALASLILGLIVLIRPVNVITVLAIPIFYHSWADFKHVAVRIITTPKYLFTTILLSFSVVSIQLILYKVQIGQFFIYSYEDEGFNFLNPEFFNFLFSYKKGLYLYTPVFAIATLGFWFWFKNRLWSAMTAIAFLLIAIYVLCSWHMWWYGGGFGTRVMIDFYVIWILAIAILLNAIKGKYRKVIITGFTILVLFTQYQTCQYRYYIIHWDGLTSTEYWDVFLKPWF